MVSMRRRPTRLRRRRGLPLPVATVASVVAAAMGSVATQVVGDEQAAASRCRRGLSRLAALVPGPLHGQPQPTRCQQRGRHKLESASPSRTRTGLDGAPRDAADVGFGAGVCAPGASPSGSSVATAFRGVIAASSLWIASPALALKPSPFLSPEDTARIFLYQPIFASVLFIGTLLYVIFKVRSATDLRDQRLVLEAEFLQRCRTSALAGQAEQDRAALEALEVELDALKAREKQERELFGWGEDTPTSKRWYFGLRLPPSDISRKYANTVGQAEANAAAAADDDEGPAIVAVLLGVPLLFVVLTYISGV